MRASLRAGIAIFNSGRNHAAHDAWEDTWRSLERNTDDERLLHGLIQYTAAIHHAHGGNRTGASGLADGADGYLDGLPDTYGGVPLVPVRSMARAVALDPMIVYRHPVPPLLHHGVALELTDLELPATGIAAKALADTDERWSAATIQEAIERARRGERDNRFAALLTDFIREETTRELVYRRLTQHLEREAAKDADVANLFGDDHST